MSRLKGLTSGLVFGGLIYLGISGLPGMASPVHFTQTTQTVPGLDQAAAVPYETATLACG